MRWPQGPGTLLACKACMHVNSFDQLLRPWTMVLSAQGAHSTAPDRGARHPAVVGDEQIEVQAISCITI